MTGEIRVSLGLGKDKSIVLFFFLMLQDVMIEKFCSILFRISFHFPENQMS